MANTRQIKRRIGSASNIAKITKAMEMVSASKMRRAQELVTAAKPYTDKLTSSLAAVAELTDPSLHPLLQENEQGQELVVIISTDRGLCGGLNTNLFKAVHDHLQGKDNFTTIVLGQKAQEFARRMDWPMLASFTDLPEHLGFADVLPLSEMIIKGYVTEQFSEVTFIYNEFVSTLSQQPKVMPLLPLTKMPKAKPEMVVMVSEYLFEPTAKQILDSLLPAFVETKIYQILLDSKASEHSARMIAMQNASNNADEVVDSLQLEYNKNRQAAITTELIEITTANLSIGE